VLQSVAEVSTMCSSETIPAPDVISSMYVVFKVSLRYLLLFPNNYHLSVNWLAVPFNNIIQPTWALTKHFHLVTFTSLYLNVCSDVC